jgi:hypothetical protein
VRVRKLTATNDYSFGQSQNNFLVNSPAAVAQIIETNLGLFSGEWYLDQTLGMPWLQGVIGKYSQATADLTVQTFIRNIPFVTDIETYESIDTQSNRNYSATTTVDTQFGVTNPITVTNQQEL